MWPLPAHHALAARRPRPGNGGRSPPTAAAQALLTCVVRGGGRGAPCAPPGLHPREHGASWRAAGLQVPDGGLGAGASKARLFVGMVLCGHIPLGRGFGARPREWGWETRGSCWLWARHRLARSLIGPGRRTRPLSGGTGQSGDTPPSLGGVTHREFKP